MVGPRNLNLTLRMVWDKMETMKIQFMSLQFFHLLYATLLLQAHCPMTAPHHHMSGGGLYTPSIWLCLYMKHL